MFWRQYDPPFKRSFCKDFNGVCIISGAKIYGTKMPFKNMTTCINLWIACVSPELIDLNEYAHYKLIKSPTLKCPTKAYMCSWPLPINAHLPVTTDHNAHAVTTAKVNEINWIVRGRLFSSLCLNYLLITFPNKESWFVLQCAPVLESFCPTAPEISRCVRWDYSTEWLYYTCLSINSCNLYKDTKRQEKSFKKYWSQKIFYKKIKCRKTNKYDACPKSLLLMWNENINLTCTARYNKMKLVPKNIE